MTKWAHIFKSHPPLPLCPPAMNIFCIGWNYGSCPSIGKSE